MKNILAILIVLFSIQDLVFAFNNPLVLINKDLRDGVLCDVEAVELHVNPDCKYISGDYSLRDIPENVSLCAIIRGDEVVIPNHKTKIEENDELLFFAKPHNIKSIESLFK